MRLGLPVWLRAGPDADLGHLPLSLDFRAVSIAEGVRAALAVAVVVTVTEWLGIPALAAVGLGSLLTCLCDPGGPIRRRLPALFSFAILGSSAILLFSLLRSQGVLPSVIGGSIWVFGALYARLEGAPDIAITAVEPGDRVVTRGHQAYAAAHAPAQLV